MSKNKGLKMVGLVCALCAFLSVSGCSGGSSSTQSSPQAKVTGTVQGNAK